MSAIAQAGGPAPHASRRLDVVERPTLALDGYAMLTLALGLVAGGGALAYAGLRPAVWAPGGFGTAMPSTSLVLLGFVVGLVGLVSLAGLTVVPPNVAVVTTFIGRYTGTLHRNGFWWLNPFCTTDRVSLALQSIENKPIKVNDHNGNPILIGAVVNWGVEDAAKAILNVGDYEAYVALQVETAIRIVASRHPYEVFEAFDDDGKPVARAADADAPVPLLGHSDEVSAELARLIDDACLPAGVRTSVARISHLAYASEIAPVMLKRQGVSALSQARSMMVSNIIATVRNAAAELEREVEGRPKVTLDPERRAAFMSNLAVMLCSEREASPVVNVGSLYGV